VIIATPNFTHRDQALAAIRAGKHVMCEKPLGLSAVEAREMYHAARQAGVVHMTAFTYRFAPSMRYLKHLVAGGQLGQPRHFRSQRFLDWPETSWGWRQYKELAGAGDLFDMTIHRIDFALDLLGPLARITGAVARFAPRTRTVDGQQCPPSTVDDWSIIIGEFASGATGVWEGTTLAKGYGRGGFGHEWAEINGSEGSAVYRLHEPNTILLGRSGQDLAPVAVPKEFLKPAASPRDPAQGEPATVFRYDLVWEFVSAIVEGRPAVPSFYDGLKAQMVADAVLDSHARRCWVDMSQEPA
jgi:predicted dehydrogenase